MSVFFDRFVKLFGRKRSIVEPRLFQVYVPEEVLNRTGSLISSSGHKGHSHEGIVYWAGVECDNNWTVLMVIAPNAKTSPGSYMTSPVANAMAVAKISEFNLHILAQVHGHPGEWVGHSEVDNHGAFMPYEGFFSIVVPWFGRKGLMPMARCGVHQFQQGRFVQLTADDVQQRFVLIPTSIDLRK